MTPAPVIGVLALQGDVVDHERLLRDCGAATVQVRLPEQLGSVDGLVIPGGESTAMWRLAEDFAILEPLSKLIAQGLPVFGSCAGMIMLADRVLDGRSDQRTFGGLDITVRRNAFGRQVQSFEADLELPIVGPEPFRAVFIRAPWVEAVGPEVEVLATVNDAAGREHVVAVRQEAVLATAFHPELTGDRRLHAVFVEAVAAGGPPAGTR